ncbi:hypothetical protein TRFO_02509 [Tritrichomonas foetus]|uniref:Uncharacterized protein n=1 Tax=Tritrichomonas foetus TaxID=1144522 RepID=A0A1J4L6B3_9EUKA|nr:hypothetical protein TRFO_02509 [Tritrichomonas foetus]|eukprot:OHT17485.1 hypothetical protein TRFO_02509 [Tritrichomonas foetus]
MSESDIDYRRQKPNQHMPTGDMISIDDLLVSDSIEPDNNTFILSKNSQRQIFSHQYFQVNEFIDIYYNNQIVAKVPNGFTTTKIIFNNEEALMITLSVSLKTESHCIFQLESKTEPIATFASGNFVDLIRQFEEFIDTNKQKDPLFPTFPKNKSIFHFFDINLWNIEGNKAVFA